MLSIMQIRAKKQYEPTNNKCFQLPLIKMFYNPLIVALTYINYINNFNNSSFSESKHRKLILNEAKNT